MGWGDPLGPDPAAAAVGVLRQIRAGWLPHRLGDGSWWWGRPAADDGFRLWASGLVPCMSVVHPMTQAEIALWAGALHPEAPEAAEAPSRG